MIRWKLVTGLAGFGMLMGLLSLGGLTRGWVEPALWMIIAVVSALVLARWAGQRYFVHGMWVGILDGVVNGVIQYIFFETFLANNPEAAADYQEATGTLEPRLLALLTGPFVGVAYGLLVGLCSIVASKILKARDEGMNTGGTTP